MAVPTLDELNQEIAEARDARIAREQAAVNRDAASAAATLAQSVYDESLTTEAAQTLQAETKLQEYISGQETPIVPPPPFP